MLIYSAKFWWERTSQKNLSNKKTTQHLKGTRQRTGDRVDEKLMKLILQQACEVAQGLSIDSKYWKDKTILTVMRTLREYLE